MIQLPLVETQQCRLLDIKMAKVFQTLHSEGCSTTLSQYNCFHHKGLAFKSINATFLPPKISELNLLMNSHKTSIVCICSTWQGSMVTTNEIKLDSCNVIQKDRLLWLRHATLRITLTLKMTSLIYYCNNKNQ